MALRQATPDILGDLMSAAPAGASARKRTPEDRRRDVKAALMRDCSALLSNRAIAIQCGVDDGLVRLYRNRYRITRRGANREIVLVAAQSREGTGK